MYVLINYTTQVIFRKYIGNNEQINETFLKLIVKNKKLTNNFLGKNNHIFFILILRNLTI